MLLVCSYQDCLNVRYPFSKLTFFNLPKDHRRKTWIKYSGNKTLQNINDKAVRYFCEKHFNPKHIRRQFNRAILHKFAEPYKYEPVTTKSDCITNSENNEIKFVEENTISVTENTVNTNNINDNLPVVKPYEYLVSKTTIDDIINEYIIATNDEIETQLDCAIKENGENIEISEENYYEEILINPKNNEPEADSDETKNISLVEIEEDSIQDSVSSENEQSKVNDSNDYENDKHFALSLVGNFQRLSAHKKAIAKIKILQYLTELEFSGNESYNNILI